MLQEWRLTIAAHSRRKEDLRAIKDMARLLEHEDRRADLAAAIHLRRTMLGRAIRCRGHRPTSYR
jgi:hypothetical protein